MASGERRSGTAAGARRRTRRDVLRLAGGGALWLASAMAVGPVQLARAQSTVSPDWEQTSLSLPVTALHTPVSGGFFAASPDAAYRSDNGGDSWSQVGLPAGASLVAVDPRNHDILYANNADGLHKSVDGGASWEPLPLKGAITVAASPADSNQIYATSGSGGTPRHTYNSQDGGASWHSNEPPLRGPVASFFCPNVLLLAHGTNPGRALRARGCVQTDIESLQLSETMDGGESWTPLADVKTPRFIVGWRGADMSRLYLGREHHIYVGPGRQTRYLGAVVERSNDDGHSWERILASMQDDVLGPEGPNITGLTYDPAHPDIVYAALGTGVKMSGDGGATWSDVGRQALPKVSDLALGVDARNLYAATEAGVRRLRLA